MSRTVLALSVVASVLAGGAVGWRAGWQAPAAGWNGKVAKIIRGGGAGELRNSGKEAFAEGATVTSGSLVATDRKQRARLEMSDGSVLVLDRDTEIELDPSPATRAVHLKHGVVIADLARVEGKPPARIITERGEVSGVETELTVTSTDDTTDVEVSRGGAHVRAQGGRDIDVEAGQEALVSARGVDVGPRAAGSSAIGAELLGENAKKEDDTARGVGELRARRPGHSDENDRPLRIKNHAVKVRIASAMARTEVEETFANDTDDDLEGIYRFPVPAGALVDRLALEVDGVLQEGAFVEKTRAGKILKGAIATATPTQRVRDDIVWVPGPWRDPALLEWQQGGRFELRIFPIPKHGSRRIVLGYTQTVESSLGLRRYVYPLPSAGGVQMDDFSVDAQVLGTDGAIPVRARGYDLASSGDRLTFHQAAFTAAGDLSIEYALPSRHSELSAWAFDSGSDGRFVAMAIRPKLPPSVEAKPRDWVVVVDSGRTMFGERFSRASRVAVSLAQTLDRRDRLTVLACDLTCRRNSAGFVPAGATAAKATADFLLPLVPDGASDLVSAVRSAAALASKGADARELRVVLVSDGVASAGYTRSERLADEVRDAMPKDAALLAVPIGADADETVLTEIARGGGGVTIPYSAQDRAENVALALAGAGAGALLRDATITLPEGLETASPSVLPVMRVGGETYVVAKMTTSHVAGDVVLHNGSFEARYPVDLTSTTDAGNAFVPRLYAALRIRDLERQSGEAARAEAIALSQKLAVPSRFTSLLVLESEAMFRAFGIDRNTTAPRWTGEVASTGSDVTTVSPDETASADDLKSASEQLMAAPRGGGAGRGGSSTNTSEGFGAGPVATMSPPAAHKAAPAQIAARDEALETPAPSSRAWWGARRPGRFMRRVFHREATIASFDGASVDGAADRVANARAALAGAPDDRGKHRELARALLRRGAFDELEQVLAGWQKRDPLDADAIAIRAELIATRGDRSAAVRVLSGVAGSADATRLDEIALGAERAQGDVEACALRIASAEKTPADGARVARAVRCERARGHDRSAERWLAATGSNRSATETALAKLDDSTAVTGDLIVDASWSSSDTADVDLAVVDPNGQRLGWLAGRGRVIDPTSRNHEKLGVSSSAGGTFLVEIARADHGTGSVSGFVNITAFGMSKRIPFVLNGPSARIARVDVRWMSELVPIDDVPEITETRGAFDSSVARARLQAVSLSSCSVQEGPFGAGSAAVTFDPSTGAASNVVVAPPFSGRASMCIARALRTARVAPFTGVQQTITRNFVIAP